MSCARFLAMWRPVTQATDGMGMPGLPGLEGFRQIGVSPDMQVWVSDRTPILTLPGQRGWIIGNLFRKDEEASSVTTLSAREAEKLLASRGQTLIDDLWGSYVAVLCPGHGAPPLLVRDPSGFMPAYLYRSARDAYCASDMACFVEAGIVTPAVNWDEVLGHLLAQELRRRRTCLAGVSELGPGQATVIDGPEPERVLWRPSDHVAPLEGSSEEIAQRLEAIVVSSVGALARSHGRILASVSGGLDSSIVSAALAGATHPFTCFTLATRDPSGDERRYAREVASACQVDCIDDFYAPDQIDPTRSMAQHLPRPVGRLFMQQIEHSYHAAATQVGADAVFTGNGGDNVFSFLHSAAPAVDRIISEGLERAALGTVRDMCRITGCDIWTMARGMGRVFLRRKRPYAWPRDLRLLSPDAAGQLLSPALTPWLDNTEALLPGKRAHIIMLMRIQNFIEGYDRRRSLPIVAPLLSQPVVELCLAIPSWKWAERGVNRSMARDAFRRCLPQSTLARTAKAGPESLTAALFERALPVLREHLLDGLLRQHGVIDRVAVEEALIRTATRRSQLFHRLLALAEAEAWSRYWAGYQAG